MLIRIVKLTFEPGHIAEFEQIFKASNTLIKNFDGCISVELLQDIAHPNVFFTYSHWESEDHLNAYRNSETFKTIWGKTKILFSDRPEAWSVHKKV
ncbi:antibiotic biosynthesis monooxygenase [Maribacter sp. ANRC-HE7]|uniref:Antibiotic biosynthesis monooxygenase n=1 Tax=Maribacter aquimaris TaxID=2737171 RepID=A0ABR7VA36_9FLAO|nr:antibiotic biosynthesis monooxygenase family protein [Maribacter aquimaris]MBD0780003.1 antibiotic biosynthesis monooxygenase [Maribacter aquimaris]